MSNLNINISYLSIKNIDKKYQNKNIVTLNLSKKRYYVSYFKSQLHKFTCTERYD